MFFFSSASLIGRQWARFNEIKQPARDVSTSPHSAPPQTEAGILALLATPFLRLALQRKNQSAFPPGDRRTSSLLTPEVNEV